MTRQSYFISHIVKIMGIVRSTIVPFSYTFYCCDILQWASYQICKIAGCACAGNAGNVSPRRRIQRKLLVSDPGMHHGTCVTHVPWCTSGSLTHGGGENVPGILGACASAISRIWQEAHAQMIPRTSSDATGTMAIWFLAPLCMFLATLGVTLSRLKMQQRVSFLKVKYTDWLNIFFRE